MSCKEFLSIVEEYVDNGLDPQASSQAAHIFACESCRTVYEELKNEQEIYSRYLLKIKEQPESWEAVRKEIRNASSVAAADAGATGRGFYERFSVVFFRQPLFASMAALVLLIGIGLGLWYIASARKGPDAASSQPPTSNQNKNGPTSPDSVANKNGTPKLVADQSQKSNDHKAGSGDATIATGLVRAETKKKRAGSTNRVADPVNEPVSFDSSEAAFNRHIEKCEMVLRSFRNAVVETDKSGVDISYERRLAKELLSSSVRFRRAAESQGNLPVENLLGDLEAILGGIAGLPRHATSSEADAIKERIQESGIIATLQIQSSIARASN